MSIGTPNGILDITGATLRVSKMEFRQSTGFDTVLNNVARNTMLLMDETEQTTSNSWALKLPNAWVAEFHGYWASGSSGAPILFNFYNDSTSGTNGYTLSMNDTAISINYDGGSALGSATLSSTLNNDAYRKVAVIFERSVLDVSVDGEHVFHFADSQLRDRVYDNNSGYVTFTHSSTDERKLKNLKFTNGDKWVREIDSSNIAYVGGNVGIGTTIPGTKLDVSGTVRGTHLIGDGSAISAIQSSNVSDFGSNVTRIGTLETDLGDNSARITTVSNDLSDNSSRITALESGDISISGDKTFTGDIIFESNVHMNSGNVFVANTVNMTVSDPIIELGSNNLNTNDLGIIMTRHGANSNVAVVFDESDDILRMGYTLNGASDSVISLDSNALAVSVQGSLGVGTPTPDTRLTVSLGAITTSANIARFHSSYDSANNGYLTIEENNHTPNNNDWTGYGTRIQKMVDSTYQGYIEFNPEGGQYSTAFGMGSTEYMRIEYPDGNVGIGTSNPVGKLDVWDGASNGTNIQQNAFFYLRNPANAATNYGAAIVFENTDGAGGTRKGLGRIAALRENNAANYSSYLQFSPTVAGTEFEAMRLTSSGNVGIGTTSPQEKFHLYGSPIIQHETRYDVGGNDGWYKLGTWDAASATGARLKISLLGAEGYGASGPDRGGETIIYASINNNIPTSASNMSGSIHAHGNPVITQAKFKQVGTDRTQYEIIAYVEPYTQHSMKIECSETTTFTRAWTSASDPGVDSATVQAALFTHVVNNAGNVGIGTTSPDAQLHIGPKDNNHIYLASANNLYGWKIDTVDQMSGNVPFRIIRRTGGPDTTVLMIKNQDGNVGIGTDNPMNRLDVRSDNYATFGKATYNAAGWSGIRLGTPYTTNHDAYCSVIESYNNHASDYNSDLRFKTSNGNNAAAVERMRITSAGNVGIGNTNPAFPLTIGIADGNKIQFNESGTPGHNITTSSGWQFNFNAGRAWTDDDAKIAFHISSSSGYEEMMRVNHTGVGIGTTGPSNKLDVQGGAAHFRGNSPGVHIQPVQTTGGGQNLFTGFRTGDSYGRAQLVLSSAYSDVIIASSQVNHNHGSNLSFVTYDPTNSSSYRKFVINQGNWGNRKQYLDFGYGDKADPNPHGYINATDTVMTLDGVNKRMGLGSLTPGYKLSINGSLYYTSGGLNGSDDRIKYNERNISNALTMISQLKPQKYEKIMEFPGEPIGTWIPTDEEWENVKEDYKYGEEFGFIAQDVRKIPELSFLVHGEETRMDTKTVSQEEYSNLSTEEQVTFTHSYTDGTNTITQEEYSNIEPTEQEVYVQQYTKQVETETPLGLNYQGLFVVAISAIQELKLKNDALEARIAALENA